MKITFIAEHNNKTTEHWVIINGPIIQPKELQQLTDVLFATIKEAYASNTEIRKETQS